MSRQRGVESDIQAKEKIKPLTYVLEAQAMGSKSAFKIQQ